MLIAARDVQLFISGLTRRHFDASRLHQNAVIKAIAYLMRREKLIPRSLGEKSSACEIGLSMGISRWIGIKSGTLFIATCRP
jgi:hypothetical protein